MSDEPTITPPHRAHMAALLLASACAVVAGVATVLLMGAQSPSVEAAALAIAGGALLMAWPAAISIRLPVLHWGALLIAGSTLRLGAIVTMGGLMDMMLPVERQAFWLGLVVGALTLLAIETAFLMYAIQGMKPALAKANGGGHA